MADADEYEKRPCCYNARIKVSMAGRFDSCQSYFVTNKQLIENECQILGKDKLLNMTAREIHDSIYDRTGVSVAVSTVANIRREFTGVSLTPQRKPLKRSKFDYLGLRRKENA